MPERGVIGWDIGGAHVKAARLERGEVLDAAQWPCELWRGTDHLVRALDAARARWPDLDACHHAVTMTGEMVDLFADREDGVRRIAALLASALSGAPSGAFSGVLSSAPSGAPADSLAAPRFFAGDEGWCRTDQAGALWPHIASANWLACARHVAHALDGREGVLVDIGSTTTDLIAFRAGRVLTTSRSDAQRLARGELVYQGVVRTPLCALTQRIAWRGDELNVMNEFFASTADVYRLTGELDPAFDQHPSADNAPKDAAATRKRLARLIGLDARDGSAAEWLAFAHAWRARQLAEIQGQLERVCAEHALAYPGLLVSAGCGAFLVNELAAPTGRCLHYARDVARFSRRATPGAAAWAQVCAPSVAVAALYDAQHRGAEPGAVTPRTTAPLVEGRR